MRPKPKPPIFSAYEKRAVAKEASKWDKMERQALVDGVTTGALIYVPRFLGEGSANPAVRTVGEVAGTVLPLGYWAWRLKGMKK